jgi:hypothetical protein
MLVAVHPGASYHCESFEGPRYARYFERLVRPEALDEAALVDASVLLVPCRTHPDRMQPHWTLLERFLRGGGFVVVTGESRPDLWIPGCRFTEVETNYWWWLQHGAELGVNILRPDHPSMRGMGKADVAWHLHGWFEPPADAETILTDREGHSIFYFDHRFAPGRMLITSLDPFFHHGSHFMPATTRFLDRFIPWLAAEAARAVA